MSVFEALTVVSVIPVEGMISLVAVVFVIDLALSCGSLKLRLKNSIWEANVL